MIETVGLKSVFRCPQSLRPGAAAPTAACGQCGSVCPQRNMFSGCSRTCQSWGRGSVPWGAWAAPPLRHPRRPSAPTPSCRPCRSCTERRSSPPSSQRGAGRRTPSTSTPSSRRGRPQVCAGRVGCPGLLSRGRPLARPGGARHPGIRGPHIQGRVQGQSPSGLFSARRQDDRDGTASPFPGAPGVSPGLLLLLLPLGLSCRFQGLTLARSRQEARGNESLT